MVLKILSILLFPFAVIYDAITSIRNRLYDMGYKPSASFEVPLISVGNLAVGGTGKTPMIEHLIRLLKPNYKVATLSRGYGRTTKGVRVANAADNASTLGDEPYQFFKKFGNEVVVTVGEERALAVPYVVDQQPDTAVVLLDDAYQHRQVKPAFQILLTDHRRPFYNDLLLPSGRLRESSFGARRADVIVVTKCPPELSSEAMMAIEKKIRKYSDKPVFFTSIRYGNVIPLEGSAKAAADKVVLVSGIAHAEPLAAFVGRNYTMVKHLEFADHHVYTEKDLKMIVAEAQAHQAMVITTEKDAVKMETEQFREFLVQVPFFYLPIEIEFLKNGKDFDEMVLNVITNA
ncbi:tetraacyldisaccharide 4'-kinase [Chryseosolibacter histidini]|nr:tetraacyldisaccharide 4'-kinase [Chryseosolibacter histidini]